MTGKPKILVDINIVLDVLAKREPHFSNSVAIWQHVEAGKAHGFLAAHSITTIAYLLAKSLPTTEVQHTLDKLLQVFSIAPIDETVIHRALSLGWQDFEDAVQMAAAEILGADYLATRNTKDFSSSTTTLVLPPGELLAILATLSE